MHQRAIYTEYRGTVTPNKLGIDEFKPFEITEGIQWTRDVVIKNSEKELVQITDAAVNSKELAYQIFGPEDSSHSKFNSHSESKGKILLKKSEQAIIRLEFLSRKVGVHDLEVFSLVLIDFS